MDTQRKSSDALFNFIIIAIIVGVILLATSDMWLPIVTSTSTNITVPSLPDETQRKIREVVRMCGYEDNFRLHNHSSKSFTRNKRDVFVCNDCHMDEQNDNADDDVVYVGLHEAAHALSKTKHHSQEWKNVMFRLMYKARDLGYLKEEKMLI